MGSKQLKAVTVEGKRTVSEADPERAKQLRKEYMKKHVGAYDLFKDYGTHGITADSSFSGERRSRTGEAPGQPTSLRVGRVRG